VKARPPKRTHCRAASLALVAAATVLSIGLTGCGGLPPVDDGGGGGTVVVLVVEAETSVPLAVNATVTVGGVRGELRPTDQQLILRDVPIGTATPPTQPLTANAAGYRTATQQVQMQVTAATWVTVAMTPADPALTGSVSGTVTDEETGQPIANAFVQFTPAGNQAAAVGGYTAADGTYLVAGIPRGQNTVTVQVAGYLGASRDVTVRADSVGQNAPADFELVGGDTSVDVTGIVVDVLTRLPVVAAQVTVGSAAPVQAGSDGRFAVADVPVGDQPVTVVASGYEELETVVRILPGMGDVTLELFEEAGDPPGGPYTITGTVTLSGAPDNAGATVRALSLTTGTVLDEATTDASGHYGLFVPQGSYELTVTFQGRSITREVTVPPGGVIVSGINFVLTV
jgi:hypothetical protein